MNTEDSSYARFAFMNKTVESTMNTNSPAFIGQPTNGDASKINHVEEIQEPFMKVDSELGKKNAEVLEDTNTGDKPSAAAQNATNEETLTPEKNAEKLERESKTRLEDSNISSENITVQTILNLIDTEEDLDVEEILCKVSQMLLNDLLTAYDIMLQMLELAKQYDNLLQRMLRNIGMIFGRMFGKRKSATA